MELINNWEEQLDDVLMEKRDEGIPVERTPEMCDEGLLFDETESKEAANFFIFFQLQN